MACTIIQDGAGDRLSTALHDALARGFDPFDAILERFEAHDLFAPLSFNYCDTGNEGNEGNEGDEGDEGDEGNENDEGDEGDENNEGDEGDEDDEGDEG